MFNTLSAQIYAFTALVICGFAFYKGGPGERTFAGAFVLAWFASLVAQNQIDRSILPWALFAIDGALLAVFGALTWKYRQAWLMWAMALQALAVVSHVLKMFMVTPSTAAFYTVLNLTAYGILVALAVGVFWAWQERRAAGLE